MEYNIEASSHVEVHCQNSFTLPAPPPLYLAACCPTKNTKKADLENPNNPFHKTKDVLADAWNTVVTIFSDEIDGQKFNKNGQFTLTLKKPLLVWKPSKKDPDKSSNCIYVYAGDETKKIKGIIGSNQIKFTEGFKIKFGFLPAIATEVALEYIDPETIKVTAFQISKTYKIAKVKEKVQLCKTAPLQ